MEGIGHAGDGRDRMQQEGEGVQGGGCAFAHFVLLGVPDWLLELKCLCKNTVSNKMQKKI
jgi:hypothetical protein